MKHIKRLYEFLMAEPAVKPDAPTRPATPQTPTRPDRPGPRIRPGEKEKEKPMAFGSAEPAVRPDTPTRPATPQTPTRPDRPGPRIRPGEKEKEKPMAVVSNILSMFFDELESIKDTKKGQEIIKKLHSKYGKKD